MGEIEQFSITKANLILCGITHASGLLVHVLGNRSMWRAQGLAEREIQFPLLPHYKTLGFSEHPGELQKEFHLKIELMLRFRLQITLQTAPLPGRMTCTVGLLG